MTGGGSPASHQHQVRATARPKLRHHRRARAEDRIRCAKTLAWPTCRFTTRRSGWPSFSSPTTHPAHLDPDAVIGAAAGGRTQDAAPAAARHRRAPDPIRAANPATAGPALALGRHGHRRRSALRAFPTPADNTAPAPTTRDHGDGPVAVRGDLLSEQVDHLPRTSTPLPLLAISDSCDVL
jgi:hypothetical protein